MPRGTKKALGQIVPGLWIGRMAAVREIFHRQEENSQEEEWSVVSMISSESMIKQISEGLQEEQQQFKAKYGRKLVRQHCCWDLPDKSHAPFVSSRLVEILQVISNGIEMTTRTNNASPVKKNCLVHCARGVSRSAAVCAAWLISCKGHSLPDAMEMIQAVRDVNPNMGFIAGLRAIEKCNGDVLKAEQRLLRKSGKEAKNISASIKGSEVTIMANQKEETKIDRTTNNEVSEQRQAKTEEKMIEAFSDEVSC